MSSINTRAAAARVCVRAQSSVFFSVGRESKILFKLINHNDDGDSDDDDESNE